MNKEELEQWENNEIGKISSIKEDKLLHKNCINKEKLIKYIKDIIKWSKKNNEKNSNFYFYDNILYLLIEKIENGEFDQW